MVIYFLQHLNPPVLPVLHEKLKQRTKVDITGSESKKKSSKKSKRQVSNKNQSAADNSTTDNELYDDIDLNESSDEALNEKNFEILKKNLQNYVNLTSRKIFYL
jgi:hypothetical protein